MKVNYLKVNGYKNLKDNAVFDLSSSSNYVAFLGLNGSGKSNILEAISLIFGNLYKNQASPFDYEIRYQLENAAEEITIINGRIEGKKVKNKEVVAHLPSQIIACYSGEELRMWEDIYSPTYMTYFNKILKSSTTAAPELLYVNKYCWNIALIALLCSDREDIANFLKTYLGIERDVNIEIKFSFDTKKYPAYGKNEVIKLISRINPDEEESPPPVSITEIYSYDLDQTDNDDLVRKIFYYLYIASMPERNKVNRYDKIIKEIEISFNGINLKSLSEGEKKLLLIKCITDVLADSKSIILLDEPDAHVHISRKKEIKKIIDKDSYFTFLTTHSPTLLSILNDDNCYIVNNTEDGQEVIKADKIKAIETVTNGEFNLMDATLAIATKKDILLVEGENDYLYILEALKRLNITKGNKFNPFNFLIINCGGAGNVPAIFREIILPHLNDTQLCIATFDADGAGQSGINGVKAAIEGRAVQNVITMTHTPIAGWDITKEFFMEDYFPVNSYKTILINVINGKNKIKDFHSLSKDSAKNIIKANYLNFNDADYDNFELLLDEFVRVQHTFHNP